MKMFSAMSAVAVLSVAGGAFGVIVTDPNDPRSFQGATVGTFATLYFGSDTLATRQQVVDAQLLDDGIFDPLGYRPGSLLATPWALNNQGNSGHSFDLTGTGSFDFTYTDGGNLFDAANGIDNRWFQSSRNIGDTVFDFGRGVLNAAVFPVIDHGPLPQEAIESTVYLSNDLINWQQAHVLRVFLEGFQQNTAILWDGFTYVVGTETGESFRYASITAIGPGSLQPNFGDEDEINGLLGFDAVPAPGTAGLLGLGALVAAKRRRA